MAGEVARPRYLDCPASVRSSTGAKAGWLRRGSWQHAPMSRRVLFLDVDGVLHPGREPGALGPSDHYMRVGPFGWVRYLATELEVHPDVEIVVHSSWREVYSLEELQEMLAGFGDRRIDVTPPGARCESIAAWLQAQGGEVRFLVLDDEPGEFLDPGVRAGLVECDRRLGASEVGVLRRVRRWLEGPGPGRGRDAC